MTNHKTPILRTERNNLILVDTMNIQNEKWKWKNGKIPNWEILSLIWCNSHVMWLSSLCEGKHVVSETERAKREGKNSNNKAGIRNRIGNWIRWWTAILYFWELQKQKLRGVLVNKIFVDRDSDAVNLLLTSFSRYFRFVSTSLTSSFR